MPQEIGVESVFGTRQFSRGLGIYLKGLTSAVNATNSAVATFSSLGAALNNQYNITNTNGRLAIATLNALQRAAQRANQSIVAANNRALRIRGPQQGGATQGNVVGGNTVAQVNAATNATRNLGRQARRTQVDLQGLTTKSIAVGTAIGTIAGNALVGFARGLGFFGSKVLEVVTFFERLNLSIEFYVARSIKAENASLTYGQALAQASTEAEGLAIWLQRLAVASPFTTRDVGTLFRTAQAYGLTRQEAELLTPLLLDFAAAAGLNEDILERLALAVGQIRARGKLTGEEVRQLGNSGIPIRDILVKALGIANDEFDELLESGALTSNVVIPAIIESLKDFEGAGERVSFGTIGGIVSAMEELNEISLARFFTGVLAPLKQSFQDLFAELNRPEVLAFIQILGEEIGQRLKAAVLGFVDNIRGLIAAWRALEPVQQQQIIVFAAATAGVFALIAAFGLLTIAVNLLLSPISLIAITLGFLVSEWTSGFNVLGSITQRVTATIARTLNNLGTSVGNAVAGFLDFLSDANLGFRYFVRDFSRFGYEAISAFVDGFDAANGLIISAIQNISRLFTFWFAPGSPPRIAPNIDEYGRATMEEFGSGMSRWDFTKTVVQLRNQVEGTVHDEFLALEGEGYDAAANFGAGLLRADLRGPARTVRQTVVREIASPEIQEEAAAAGIRVSEEFVNGFLSRIPQLTPRMSDELAEVLGKIGSGIQLSRNGALAFGRFLQGFGDADFGVLDQASGVVEEFLSGLVESGEIDDIDLPRLLFGAREDLARGIKDIQEVGKVTQGTLQRIRTTAGGASGFVIQLLEAYAPLSQATQAVESAQANLNAVTERYKAIITPLREELERINEVVQRNSEQERILSLQRLIANEAVSNRRRSAAQAEIQQILAERRVRGLEKERDAATETAEAELKARQETVDQLEEQFNVIQANIQAQLAQIGLYTQEASIVRKLQEEAAKLREKELTEAELQQKFLELQNEELRDLIEAARAKYDLTRADSTELEKQQAQITLAEIALRRRNREAEAIKLGIPVEELTKLRDFEVTLDDIGVKSKDAFKFDSDGTGLDSLINANEISQEWRDTLAEVRDRWDEIKQRIIDTATTINDNLPSFLRIFPEETGGTPPIIEFIQKYAAVVIGLAVAINTYKIVSRVVALTRAIRGLMGLGGAAAAAGGAAAGAGGAAAAGGGAAGVIAAITVAVVNLGGAALVATGYILALKAALDAFQSGQESMFEGNTQVITDTLGDFGPTLTDETNKLIENAGVGTEEARRGLVENIVSAATQAISDGFGNEHVVASIGNAVTRSIAEGLIADTPENRAAISQFQTNLQTALQGAISTGEAPKVNIFTGAVLEAVPTAEQEAEVKAQVGTFLSGIADEEQKSQFATSVENLVRDGVAVGLTDAQIHTYVLGAFNEGVAAGLVADTEANRTAIKSYVDGLIDLIQAQSEVESPSKLTEREIGVPLGEGILKGIGVAFDQGSTQLVTTAKIMFGDLETTFGNGRNALIRIAEDIREKILGKIVALKTALGVRMSEIVTAQKTAWTTIRTDAEAQTEALRLSTDTAYDNMRTSLVTKMAEIKRVVTSAFVAMRTESEKEVEELRAAVVDTLAGEENSLLSDLNLLFIGKNSIVARNIGKLFIDGIAQGITTNRQTLADAMADAVQYALLTTAQTQLEISSPSAVAAREIGLPWMQGIAQGIIDNMPMVSNAARAAMASAMQAPVEARYGARPGTHSSVTNNAVYNTYQYQLSVSSMQQSQGVISDFAIMQTLAGA